MPKIVGNVIKAKKGNTITLEYDMDWEVLYQGKIHYVVIKQGTVFAFTEDTDLVFNKVEDRYDVDGLYLVDNEGRDNE